MTRSARNKNQYHKAQRIVDAIGWVIKRMDQTFFGEEV